MKWISLKRALPGNRGTGGLAGIAVLSMVALSACGSGDAEPGGDGSASSGTSCSTSTSLEDLGGMDALAASAKMEGGMTIYSIIATDRFAEWTKDFTDKYGVEITQYRDSSGPMYARFAQEQNVNKNAADVLLVSDYASVKDAIERKWLAEYTPEGAASIDPDSTVPGYAYPTYLSYSAVGWNTKVVPEDLQAKFQTDPYGALLDPRLKGKVVVSDPSVGGPSAGVMYTVVELNKDTLGWPYLEKLAEQDVVQGSGTTAIGDQIANGQYWATTAGSPTVYGALATEGAAVAFASTDSVAATLQYTSAVSAAPHPCSARLFMEWMTSADAQDAITLIQQGLSAREGWVDERSVKDFDWYSVPTDLDVTWILKPEWKSDAPEFMEDSKRWNEILGH